MKLRSRRSKMTPRVPSSSIAASISTSSSRVAKSSSPVAATTDVSPPTSFVFTTSPGNGLSVKASSCLPVCGRCSVVRWRLTDVGQRRLWVLLLRKISERHDADGFVPLDHGEAADGLLAHETHGLVGGVVRGNGADVLCRYLADANAVRVSPLGNDADGDIAVGHDPFDVAVVHHKDRAYALLFHQTSGLNHRLIFLHGQRIRRHHVADFLRPHVVAPSDVPR